MTKKKHGGDEDPGSLDKQLQTCKTALAEYKDWAAKIPQAPKAGGKNSKKKKSKSKKRK